MVIFYLPRQSALYLELCLENRSHLLCDLCGEVEGKDLGSIFLSY